MSQAKHFFVASVAVTIGILAHDAVAAGTRYMGNVVSRTLKVRPLLPAREIADASSRFPRFAVLGRFRVIPAREEMRMTFFPVTYRKGVERLVPHRVPARVVFDGNDGTTLEIALDPRQRADVMAGRYRGRGVYVNGIRPKWNDRDHRGYHLIVQSVHEIR